MSMVSEQFLAPYNSKKSNKWKIVEKNYGSQSRLCQI